jgi:hypothetical protein
MNVHACAMIAKLMLAAFAAALPLFQAVAAAAPGRPPER